MTDPTSALYAQKLDAQEELATFRDKFVIDDAELIYLDGNSLGRLPRENVSRLHNAIREQWGQRLIRSFNDAWFDLPERLGSKLAILLGAQPEEVIIADSTSVNLFKLVLAAIRSQRGRTKIVTDNLNFPSDIYILQGLLDLLGSEYSLEVVPSADDLYGPIDELARAIDQNTALVTLSHTAFKSGYTYDMNAVTELAHQAGALILWDTSHSAGAMPVYLNEANVDLAIGCTYKYLNGGPGAPAFLFVRLDLQDRLSNPISGWMGQKKPFDFDLDYEPASGMRRFLSGTPPILSLVATEMGIDILLEAGLERVRAKSVRQTEYLITLWETMLAPLGFELKSPRESRFRGSHVSLGHAEGLRIDRALIEEMKVIPDFRYPDNIRLGIAPLYTTFEEIHEAVGRISDVVVNRLYERYPLEAPIVT